MMKITIGLKISVQLGMVHNWVNYSKVSATYDGENNRIEDFLQTWDGSNWVIYD